MNITIRKGAAYHDLTITEGDQVSTFDMAAMTKGDRHKTRRMLVGALESAGVLDSQDGKFSVLRGKANAKRRPRRNRNHRKGGRR